MIRVGLRFARRDAPALREWADRVRRGEVRGDLNTFAGAAASAQTGEPLIVYCERPEEGLAMADMYVLIGVSRPAVEELTGQRPAR